MILPCASGEMTEKSIWTNSSPNSAFSGQDITLSESIDNFKYIAVEYKSAYTLSLDSQKAKVIYRVEDVKKNTSPSTASSPVSAFGNLDTGNNFYYYRFITYKEITKINISVAYRINATGNSTGYAIPLEIFGLN